MLVIEQAAFVKMTARIKASVDRRGITGVGGNMTSVGGVVVAGAVRVRVGRSMLLLCVTVTWQQVPPLISVIAPQVVTDR